MPMLIEIWISQIVQWSYVPTMASHYKVLYAIHNTQRYFRSFLVEQSKKIWTMMLFLLYIKYHDHRYHIEFALILSLWTCNQLMSRFNERIFCQHCIRLIYDWSSQQLQFQFTHLSGVYTSQSWRQFKSEALSRTHPGFAPCHPPSAPPIPYLRRPCPEFFPSPFSITGPFHISPRLLKIHRNWRATGRVDRDQFFAEKSFFSQHSVISIQTRSCRPHS